METCLKKSRQVESHIKSQGLATPSLQSISQNSGKYLSLWVLTIKLKDIWTFLFPGLKYVCQESSQCCDLSQIRVQVSSLQLWVSWKMQTKTLILCLANIKLSATVTELKPLWQPEIQISYRTQCPEFSTADTSWSSFSSFIVTLRSSDVRSNSSKRS